MSAHMQPSLSFAQIVDNSHAITCRMLGGSTRALRARLSVRSLTALQRRYCCVAAGRTLVVVESPAKASAATCSVASFRPRGVHCLNTVSLAAQSCSSCHSHSPPISVGMQAKKIGTFLGSDYVVLASYGHVRDLVQKPGSVDPENAFAMLWQSKGKGKQHVKEISSALGTADQLVLATDADREGEAISWHLTEVLRVRSTVL